MSEDNRYIDRYPQLSFRTRVWREIVRYVRRDAGRVETLLELGAGFCDFINQFPADKRIGYDLNPKMKEFAAVGVDLRIEDAIGLNGVEDESVDLVFASNFLEHLTEEEHAQLIPRVRQVMKKNGRLILLQPNHRLCEKNYWDDDTHRTVFSDRNIGPFLASYGLRPTRLIGGLLPFSLKSRLPKWPILVRLYLNSPFRPLAAQMYVVAEKEVSGVAR